MNHINTLYRPCGFHITQANMYGEFEPIRAVLLGLGITLSTVSREENFPEAERNVRTLKYRVWSVLNTLPFHKSPDRMIIDIFLGQVFWLNVSANKYGVSKTTSPRQIMSGLKIYYHCHCHIDWGQYVQTHEHHGNNMMERTVGAIALLPTGNWQGGYYFYSIITGRVLNRHYCTELTTPDKAIQIIEKMSRRRDHECNFTYPNGTAIIDDDDDNNGNDYSYAPSDHEDDDGYPSLPHDKIVEQDISGVDYKIKDDNADSNTADSKRDIPNDANTEDGDVLQPPNDANTKYEDTKDAKIEDEDTKEIESNTTDGKKNEEEFDEFVVDANHKQVYSIRNTADPLENKRF